MTQPYIFCRLIWVSIRIRMSYMYVCTYIHTYIQKYNDAFHPSILAGTV